MVGWWKGEEEGRRGGTVVHLSCAQQIVSINNNCARTCRPLRNGAGQVQGVAKDDSRAGKGSRGSRKRRRKRKKWEKRG